MLPLAWALALSPMFFARSVEWDVLVICPVEAVVMVYRQKSRLTWLVPAMATLVGAVFLLGGIAVEPRLRSVHHSWVKT
jgi:hypothetical protein